jgi:FimV-like protein
VADNESFQRAGLERASYVGSIRIEAVTDGPNPRLELTSKELAREPLLTLLVEVRTPGGPRMLREYTVLLDPAVTPATINQESSSDFFQTPEEARAGRAGTGSRDREPGTYGPVGPTETLWMVAQAVKPPGVGLDQAMLALYETNRGAFRDGDIDALRKGSVLDVPSTERMQSISNSAARARVLELSSRDKASVIAPSSPFSSGEPAAPARPSTPAQPAPPPVAAVTPAPAPVTPPPAAATTETPATGATSATPAPGETATVPAEGEAATAATPPAGTESTAPESAAQAPAAEGEAPDATPTPATTETAPAATTGPAEESGGWVSKLVPILIALIVALIGFAVWRSARERKAQREYEQASREGGGPSMPAPRVGATGSIGSAKAATSARAELEALDRQMDDDATRIADDDATRMVTTSKIPPYTGPQAADGMDEAELAVTTQFQANTKEIKLGDNDPLSEADFHLAYGLYDEAALLLQQASARAPQRTDLRVKLAETYFAAGKATEFEQIAAGLKGEVNDEEWGKLAILGRQLLPDAPLFHGTDDATSADTVLDLTFDDDATQIAPVKVDEGLEFKLEELELPTRADNAASSQGQALEFDLGEFDLSGTDKTSGGGNKKPPAPAPEPLQLKDFDLGGTDLAGGDKGGLDVRLDEVEPLVIDDPSQDEGLSSSDDAATKLDLARAYVEMGDSEMARSLLDEVAKIGTDDQKREAGALRERLLG